MTNRAFSATAFSNFSSPSQGIATPNPFDEMALPTRDTIVSTKNGSSIGAGPIDDVIYDAWTRYETAKRNDQDRNALIEELIHRYSFVSTEHSKLSLDLEREKEFSRNYMGSNDYKQKYEDLKRNVDRDPFVLVLLDGDGMIFHDQLLKLGEEGGLKAADILHQSSTIYAREMCPDLPNDFRVVTRMYANIKGLADVCARANIVANPAILEDFMRGFTRGRTLFDFVDVGPGKDRADEKVSEMFKLHVYDPRCKHVIFGCSHDNGFARLLEKYMFDTTVTKRVTLLEGVPFEKELVTLPYKRQKFGSLFRAEKINVNAAQILGPAAIRSLTRTPSESVSSLTESGYNKPGAISSWASKAAAAATVLPPTPPVQKTVLALPLTKETIPRNRAGQRVDPILKYDKEAVDKVRRLKMCNIHFLRNECPYGEKCTHRHDKAPTPKELEILRVVARMACCRNGSACEDPKCIYGHRCQAPERMDKAKYLNDGGRTCIFGPECVFGPEFHDTDLNVVKTTRV